MLGKTAIALFGNTQNFGFMRILQGYPHLDLSGSVNSEDFLSYHEIKPFGRLITMYLTKLNLLC